MVWNKLELPNSLCRGLEGDGGWYGEGDDCVGKCIGKGGERDQDFMGERIWSTFW